MEIDNIFDNIKFKLNPEEDYRKAYTFRFQKGLFKLLNLERKFLFDNCIINKKYPPSSSNQHMKFAKCPAQITLFGKSS